MRIVLGESKEQYTGLVNCTALYRLRALSESCHLVPPSGGPVCPPATVREEVCMPDAPGLDQPLGDSP